MSGAGRGSMTEGRVRTGLVLVVHGSYARQLLEAARTVVGPVAAGVVEVQAGASRADTKQRVAEAASEEERGAGVVLLVDVCGSTPANICLELMALRPGIAVVTGLSLAMLMKAATADEKLSAAELAAELHRSAQRSVQLGSELLHKGASGGC